MHLLSEGRAGDAAAHQGALFALLIPVWNKECNSSNAGNSLAGVFVMTNAMHAQSPELTPLMIDILIEGESPLRVWRRRRGMTVGVLAEKVGIKPKKIVAIESGHAVLKGVLLDRIASALNVSPLAVGTRTQSLQTHVTLYPA